MPTPSAELPHKFNPGCTIITCSMAGQHAMLVNQMQIGSSWAKLPQFNSYPMAIPFHFCYFTSQGYVLYYTTTERSYVDIIFIGAPPTVKMTQITCLQTNNNYAWIPSVTYFCCMPHALVTHYRCTYITIKDQGYFNWAWLTKLQLESMHSKMLQLESGLDWGRCLLPK